MSRTNEQFYYALGQRESNGNYKAVNPYKYLGKYQIGEAALVDAGYYCRKASGNYNNDWRGKWTGKDGVYSVKEFLNNNKAQENAIRTYMKIQWRYLTSVGATKYIGKTINGVKITASGLLAGAHLRGVTSKRVGGVLEYLKSNGRINPKDGYGTSIGSYIQKFGGYDVSPITKHNTRATGYAADIDEQFLEDKDVANIDSDGNKIYTKEDLDKMSKDDLEKNHDKIMKQVYKMGIPTQAEINASLKKKPVRTSTLHPNAADGDGHWVTIDGNHVFFAN